MARCKFGKLKNPKGRRICRRKPRRGGARRGRARRSGSARRCRFGKLKNPSGRRVCKRKPFRGGRRLRSKRSQESAMWKLYESGKLGAYKRRRRSRR